MLAIKQATKLGYIPLIEGGVADLSYPSSKTRRGRVQGNGMICPTLCTESEVCVISRKDFNPGKWMSNSTKWVSDSVKKVTDSVSKATDKIIDLAKNKFAIRRLTPRECWRLMSFGYKREDGTWDDTDFEKAQSVCSDTQLYKQAGNSICECVLKAIFSEMLPQ